MSVKQDDETTITVAVGEKKRAEIAQAIAAALIEGYKKERKIYEKFARIIRDGGGILRKKLKDSFRITVTTEGGIPDVDVNVTENLPNAGSVLQSGHPILEDRIIDGATLEEILDNRIDLGEDVNGIVWKYNLDLQSYRGKKGETIDRKEINAALSDAVQKGIEQFYKSVGIKQGGSMFVNSKLAIVLVALVAGCNHYSAVSESTDGNDPIVRTHSKPEAAEVLATSDARYRGLKSYHFTGKNIVERRRRRETTEEVARVSFVYNDSKSMEASLERKGARFNISSKGSTSSIILVTEDSDEKTVETYDDELDCLSSPLLGYGNYFGAGRLSLIAKRKKLGESLFSELTNATLVGIEPIEGFDCFRIDGGTEGNPYVRITYWINADSSLVQKYVITFSSKNNSEYFTRFSETYDRVEFR